VLRAEGEKQSAILKAEGQAQAITSVFESIHKNDPDPKLLAYQYLQTLPQIAQGPGNTMWMIPSELTSALKALSSAFDGAGAAADTPGPAPSAQAGGANGPGPTLTAGAEDSAADAALAEVVRHEPALAGNAVPEPSQAALAAAMAAVPAPTALPEVPLPEALLRTDAVPESRLPEAGVTDPAVLEAVDGLTPVDVGDVQDDPTAANGAAAGPA
jgi:hypothetical protein